MMRRLRKLHLKSKLILLAAASGALALVLACSGFVLNDIRLLHDSKLRQLRTQAQLLGFNSSVVVSMHQARLAGELLNALETQPSIELAGLYDEQGQLVAGYSTLGDETASSPIAQREGYRLTPLGKLEVFHPIYESGVHVGTVYLRAHMNDIWEQFISYSKVSLLVMVVALGVSIVFASMMQRSISGPILRLADAAQQITSSDDYSIRVRTDAGDELGLLYSSFNRMIEQVDASRKEIELAQEQLEQRVEDRTQQLQCEIKHREQVQDELVRAKNAAEAANRAKSSFLANMSHEIRTPLNAILGFTDLLRRGMDQGDEAERRDFLETVHHSGEHLLTLINDILDLSKIEAGQMEYERIRFSPHQVIAEVMSVMRARAQMKGLALEYHWSGQVPETIESDPARFRQLLLNLIGNAIKFTESGAVQAIARLDVSRCELAIDIVDTGIGIPAHMLDAVFTPFTQADNSVTRRFGGTGLGLPICRHIAKGLGGNVVVQSQEGRGSTFSATIATGPLASVRLLPHPASDILVHESYWPGPAGVHLNGHKILVVDDGDTNRKLIRLVLSRAGADVVMAGNGLEAVMATREHQFDMILMDMQMPVMDGYSATGRLRDEGYKRPIVALTAHAMRGDAERCLAAGCSDYLTKPINPVQLLEKIASILEESVVEPISDEASIHHEPNHTTLVSELPTDDAEFAEIVREFAARAQNKLVEMQSAHANGDHAALAQLSHWLKGAGGTAGFPILTETARQLENAVKCVSVCDIDARLNELDQLIGSIVMPEVMASCR